MKFYSTKKISPDVDFRTALLRGLAPDGGLYMPRTFPKLAKKDIKDIKTLQEIAFAVLRKWITDEEIGNKDLKKIVSDAFTFPIPLVQIGEYSVLELFHGPTMAFKDIAARTLARLFDYFLTKENQKVTILVATSGDTGGAIAQAFSDMLRVRIVILYPKGKVSKLQEEQLTRVGNNVISIALEGTFDDCQAFVKKAFRDPELSYLHLTSANSINIGRLLPQIIYYFWAYLFLKDKKLRFVVPSGNMGNATAALFAYKMGIPLDSLVIATNKNDAVVKYYKTGRYKKQKTIKTLSTAMDIGNPSNFERVLALFYNNYQAFCQKITAIKITDKQTVRSMLHVYKKEKYLMDFHTAVGYSAAEKASEFLGNTIIVSTASPIKFASEMKRQTNIVLDDKKWIKSLRRKKKRVVNSRNEYSAIKKILVKELKV